MYLFGKSNSEMLGWCDFESPTANRKSVSNTQTLKRVLLNSRTGRVWRCARSQSRPNTPQRPRCQCDLRPNPAREKGRFRFREAEPPLPEWAATTKYDKMNTRKYWFVRVRNTVYLRCFKIKILSQAAMSDRASTCRHCSKLLHKYQGSMRRKRKQEARRAN